MPHCENYQSQRFARARDPRLLSPIGYPTYLVVISRGSTHSSMCSDTRVFGADTRIHEDSSDADYDETSSLIFHA